MDRLTELGKKYGTDKAEYHGFTPFYDKYLKDLKPKQVLEIGIFTGDSLRMWADYFGEEAIINGVDIVDRNWEFEQKNILRLIGDVNSDYMFGSLRLFPLFDLIIDDGSHTMKDQQQSLAKYFSRLKGGGYYIVEDLHTSGMIEYNPDNAKTTLSILEDIKSSITPESDYISKEEMIKIYNSIEWVDIFRSPNGKSITSIIKVK